MCWPLRFNHLETPCRTKLLTSLTPFASAYPCAVGEGIRLTSRSTGVSNMLRVAVLGAGRIGKIHAANVAGNHKAKLVTIVDPYGTAARNLAGHLGCDASLDPTTAIERADVDAIIIGTPTDHHVILTLDAGKM